MHNYFVKGEGSPNKVLHIVRQLDFGGVESRIKIIASNFNLTENKHIFCVIGHGGAISNELVEAGHTVHILDVSTRIPSVSAIVRLVRFIRVEKPDIIHTRGAEANFHGQIAGFICRVPTRIAEEIGFPNHSRKARMVFRQIYRLADSVVAISEAVKRKLVELGEVEAARVHVLLNPVQMHEERTAPPTSGTVKIGFVGRLEEVKNPLALVRATALLRERGLSVHLTIVGEGSQRAMLQAEIDRNDLGGIVTLAGFSSRPFDLIADTTLYVQPSLSEGFGLALVEAMSVGIPVLATSVGGAPEIITNGKNGWLLPKTDPESIANYVEEISAKGMSQLQAIGLEGRSSVLLRFSPATYLQKCDVFYRSLIPQRERRR